VAALSVSSSASSQTIDLGGNDQANIAIQNFQPIAGPQGVFTVETADTALHLDVSGGLILNIAKEPLVLNVLETEDKVVIIEDQTVLDAVFVIGLLDFIEVGIDLPIYLANNASFNNTEISGATLGDLKLRPKVSLLSSENAPVGVGLYAQLDLPTGDDEAFASSGEVAFRPGLVFDTRFEKVVLALNLATDLKGERKFGDADIGNQMAFGLAAQYEIIASKLFLGAELIGETTFDDFFKEEETPVEGLVGLKYRMSNGLNAEIGAGGGIIGGLGTPSFRFFTGLRYAKYVADLDEDGIDNSVDACPREPEDRDLFEDEDGCPEVDNDRDGLADQDDSCPNEAEDVDGFQDEDGCPDTDNDADSIPDSEDKCPMEAEDLDGFDDEDGCPEVDNDRDGIPDAKDKCPEKPETLNGVEDDDGCPDEDKGKAIVDIEPEKKEIVILQRVFFETGRAEILERSFALLNAVALTLKGNPEITLIEIQGHTDDRGDDTYNLDLSNRRAMAVRAFLIQKGLDKARLTAKGYGEGRPATKVEGLSGEALEKARTKNRRVQFKIVKKK
jgi:outer membrane protein OmpA-like peptidoglycan-associated protein